MFSRPLVSSPCRGVLNTVAAARLPVLTAPADAAPLPLSVPLARSARATWKLLLRWPLTFLWKWNFLVWRLSMLNLIHPCSCTQMTILWKHCRVRFPPLWGRHPQWGNTSLFEPWAPLTKHVGGVDLDGVFWLSRWKESYVNASKGKKKILLQTLKPGDKTRLWREETDRKKMKPHKDQMDVFGKLLRAL